MAIPDEQPHTYQHVASMAHIHGLANAGLLTSEQAQADLDALANGPQPPSLPPTSHDHHATVFRLWTRDAILDVAALLVELRQALTDLAARAGAALAPGTEPPVLLAHYLLAYVEQLYRDGNRLKEAYVRADILPLGSGDGAGVAVDLDRGAIARLLGMHATTRNSVDGVGDRDFAVETLADLAMIGARLARLIGDPVLDIPAPMPATGTPSRSPKAPPAAPRAALPPLGSSPAPAGTDDEFWARRLARARNPGGLISEEWQSALIALARIPQGHHASLAKIEDSTRRAVERTQAALTLAIDLVRDLPAPAPGISDQPAEAAHSLASFVSRGGTAPDLVREAIADTHARIDTYRQWIAERRAAHPTVEALRHYPAERNVSLLPHNDPPPATRA